MTTYLLNGFSFQMNQVMKGNISFKFIDKEEARLLCMNAESKVGKRNLARVLSNEFGFPINYNPGNIELQDGDNIIVAYYVGKKLPENATTRPRNSLIEFVHARIEEVAA